MTDSSKVQRYLEASVRENTRRSYASALQHFEVTWGGFLPATADSVARYLADYSEQLSLNTLQLRLAALAQWHLEQGFPDPTKAPLVRNVFKGIRALHPAQTKQAKPLQLQELERLDGWLESQLDTARRVSDRAMLLRLARDRALVLLGFWRGFRSDELVNLRAEFVDIVPGEGMACFIARTKGDRALKGQRYRAPALQRLCPVAAYLDWMSAAGIESGPVFRAITRNGRISENALHPGSVVPMVRRLFQECGIEAPDDYSGHSLRRGFATWASRNGWDVKTLMEYVGWKSVASALRYVEAADPFARHRIEHAIQTTSPPTKPAQLDPRPTLALEVTVVIERFSRASRGHTKARRLIEAFCLAPYAMVRLSDTTPPHYRIAFPLSEESELDERMAELVDEMYRIANTNDCALEVEIRDPDIGRVWQ